MSIILLNPRSDRIADRPSFSFSRMTAPVSYENYECEPSVV